MLLIENCARDAEVLLAVLRDGGHTVRSRQLSQLSDLQVALREEHWDAALLSCDNPELPAAEALALIQAKAPKLLVILTIKGSGEEFPGNLLGNGHFDFVHKNNPARLLTVVGRECSQVAQPASAIDESEARFFQLANNIPECYWLADAETQRITFVSKGYEQIWGLYVEALYADNRDWLKYVHADDQARLSDAMLAHRLGGLDVKFRLLRPGDNLRWLHARNFPVRNDEGNIISVGGVATDITSQVAEQQEVHRFARFDALTELPNQPMFYDQARRLIALAKRKAASVGLMVVDIDRFREVNQTLGHTAGDELLRQVAGRLTGLLRESDILGRIGADVFAILLPDIADVQQAGVVARRLIDTLITPLRVDSQDIFATASLGIVLYPQDGKDVHELVSNAEMAVVHVKSQGRNSYQFYSVGMHDGIRDRLFLETDLRNATLRNEFVLYYQPKVSCANGRITGAEALVRWQHPRRGIVPPDQFIPLLEETGLIVPVGHWVLEEACRQAVEWQQAGFDLPSISVNLSARQLQSETLLDDVASILAKTGLKPSCLDLEITESMLMQNADSAIHMLNALKAMGVTLSLDDFGTGYSSLSYLKRFPLDAVKVDRSFVQDITADSDDASITRAVITMAHHLKLKVVAEGVETSEQLALLMSHQCDIIQGYFFSRPLPVPGMTELLVSDKRLPASLLRSCTREPMALFVAVDGFDEVISMLASDGHRVCSAPDLDSAMQWLAGNMIDVLVCGASHPGFDAFAVIEKAVQNQPQCERILLADSQQWHNQQVAELSSSGLVQRVIHLPVAGMALRQTIEDALSRRHIADEYNRLSHEVEVAEREMVRIEEERRRLAAQNKLLQAQESQGYQILQEVVAELPWPVFGIDADGMLAMINDAAFDCFADRDLAPGALLLNVLPEAANLGDNSALEIQGRHYICRWRQVMLGGSVRGRLLLLEEKTK